MWRRWKRRPASFHRSRRFAFVACSNIGTANCVSTMVHRLRNLPSCLGKLGGSELNHSSDVDLLFLYSEEGQLTPHISYHEFFNRLGKRILETFSTPHP